MNKVIGSKMKSLTDQANEYAEYVKILENKLRKLYNFERLEEVSYKIKEDYEQLTELEKLEDRIDFLFSINVKMKQLIDVLENLL